MNFSSHDSRNWIFLIWLKELNLYYLTQRIEPYSFLTWRNALNFFFCRKELSLVQNGSKNWIGFFDVTQRIELFSLICLTELTFFLYDSQNWTFLKKITQGNEFFSNMTQRIVFFQKKKTQRIECFFNISQRTDFFMIQRIFFYDAKNWTLFVRIWRKEWNPFFCEYDSKNWTFFLICLKELSFFFLNMTQRIVFFDMTQRIELFWNES